MPKHTNDKMPKKPEKKKPQEKKKRVSQPPKVKTIKEESNGKGKGKAPAKPKGKGPEKPKPKPVTRQRGPGEAGPADDKKVKTLVKKKLTLTKQEERKLGALAMAKYERTVAQLKQQMRHMRSDTESGHSSPPSTTTYSSEGSSGYKSV